MTDRFALAGFNRVDDRLRLDDIGAATILADGDTIPYLIFDSEQDVHRALARLHMGLHEPTRKRHRIARFRTIVISRDETGAETWWGVSTFTRAQARTAVLRQAQNNGARILCGVAPYEGTDMLYRPRNDHDSTPWILTTQEDSPHAYRYTGLECVMVTRLWTLTHTTCAESACDHTPRTGLAWDEVKKHISSLLGHQATGINASCTERHL
jgi:hypothetical protein